MNMQRFRLSYGFWVPFVFEKLSLNLMNGTDEPAGNEILKNGASPSSCRLTETALPSEAGVPASVTRPPCKRSCVLFSSWQCRPQLKKICMSPSFACQSDHGANPLKLAAFSARTQGSLQTGKAAVLAFTADQQEVGSGFDPGAKVGKSLSDSRVTELTQKILEDISTVGDKSLTDVPHDTISIQEVRCLMLFRS